MYICPKCLRQHSDAFNLLDCCRASLVWRRTITGEEVMICPWCKKWVPVEFNDTEWTMEKDHIDKCVMYSAALLSAISR